MVKLAVIVEQMELANEEINSYLNTKTEEILTVQAMYQSVAEELEADDTLSQYQDWEQEEIRAAWEIAEHWDDFVKLPDQYEIHEYSIMRDFVEEVADLQKREALYRAISGTKAYQKFKDMVHRLKLEKAWFTFKRLRYYRIAEEWCQIHKLEYTEEE